MIVIGESSPEQCDEFARVDPPRRAAGSTVELAHGRANGLDEWNGEFLINLKRFPPGLTGLITFYSIGSDVTQPAQRVSFTAPITELLSKGQSLGVVLASSAVFADAPLNVAQSPHRVDFNAPVTELPGEGQRLGVVLAG